MVETSRESSSRHARSAPIAVLLAIGLTLTAASTAHAQPREDGAPAEALGAGDAVRGSIWGPGALYFNPAGLIRVPSVLFEAGYSYLESTKGHGLAAAAIDSKSNEFAAIGVAYSYITGAPGGRDRDGHQFRGGLGTGYRSNDFALYAGIGARYLELQYGADDAKSGEHDDVDAWTLDLGIMIDFANRIRFGVVGQNLVDGKRLDVSRGLGIGLSFVFDTLDVGADLTIDLSERFGRTIKSYAFGASYGFAGSFFARAGFVGDLVAEQERATVGFGWSMSQLAINIAWSSAFTKPTDMIVSLSLRYSPPL